MRNARSLTGVAVLLVILFAGAANGTNIFLIDPTTRNGSFELLDGSSGSTATVTHWDTHSAGDIDDWTVWTEEAGTEDDSGAYASPHATDGSRAAFLKTDNAAYNMTTHTIAVGDIFAYSFDNVLSGRGSATMWLVYDDGGAISKITGSDITGAPVDTYSNTFTVQAGAWAGKTIGAGLHAIGSYPEIDNVTLSVTPIPEPATLSLLALGSLALVRRKRRA